MKKVIAVTGVPCSGKTTLAKQIVKKLNGVYVGLEDVKKIDKKIVYGFDDERGVEIIDEDLYEKAVAKIIKDSKKPVVVDLHFSHIISKKLVDLCIVCRCNLKELRRRMVERGYSGKKIQENMDVEIFDEILVEAQELGHNLVEINTTSPADEGTLKAILGHI